MKILVLLRHGESIWNKENRFTGWTDVDLSPKGINEARAAGSQMLRDGYVFDVAYTSVLKRAIRTLWLALDEMDLMWIPVFKSWRLNERHYGALQGLNKRETVERHGEEQVKLWRRSYDIQPPALAPDDPRAPYHDPRYRECSPNEIPLTECLKDTVDRVLPYWNQTIAPGGALLLNEDSTAFVTGVGGATPEPGAASLLALGLGALLARSRARWPSPRPRGR